MARFTLFVTVEATATTENKTSGDSQLLSSAVEFQFPPLQIQAGEKTVATVTNNILKLEVEAPSKTKARHVGGFFKNPQSVKRVRFEDEYKKFVAEGGLQKPNTVAAK